MVSVNFSGIAVSTKTIIGISNVELDIDGIFNKLPITPYVVIQRRRGRKKKEQEPDPNQDIPIGSIITAKLAGLVKGVDLKQKKKTDSRRKYFRNSLTIVMKIGVDKLINFKLSKNGKFQITGAKYDQHAKDCIKYFWDIVRPCTDLYSMVGTDFNVVFVTVMTNIDFNLGFIVNREQLDKYMNSSTLHNSLLETSFGYTGVNIKFPANGYRKAALLPKIVYRGKWDDETMSYEQYFQGLTEKEQLKITQKDKYTTFLVFHSGNVIMSGLDKVHMESTFNEFIGIINECKPHIEEKLLT